MKKSKGFNWGPSAVSTTHWTGVRLCDLLRYCGVRRPSQGAKHVLFAGVEKELPQARPAHRRSGCSGLGARGLVELSVEKELPQARPDSGFRLPRP